MRMCTSPNRCTSAGHHIFLTLKRAGDQTITKCREHLIQGWEGWTNPEYRLTDALIDKFFAGQSKEAEKVADFLFRLANATDRTNIFVSPLCDVLSSTDVVCKTHSCLVSSPMMCALPPHALFVMRVFNQLTLFLPSTLLAVHLRRVMATRGLSCPSSSPAQLNLLVRVSQSSALACRSVPRSSFVYF